MELEFIVYCTVLSKHLNTVGPDVLWKELRFSNPSLCSAEFVTLDLVLSIRQESSNSKNKSKLVYN